MPREISAQTFDRAELHELLRSRDEIQHIIDVCQLLDMAHPIGRRIGCRRLIVRVKDAADRNPLILKQTDDIEQQHIGMAQAASHIRVQNDLIVRVCGSVALDALGNLQGSAQRLSNRLILVKGNNPIRCEMGSGETSRELCSLWNHPQTFFECLQVRELCILLRRKLRMKKAAPYAAGAAHIL